MNSDIEEGIANSKPLTEEEIEAVVQDARKIVSEQAAPAENISSAGPEMVGNAWACDAIKEALSKPTPEEAKFYLNSLREMALHLLANDCFNEAIGIKLKLENPTWNPKRFQTAQSNVVNAINTKVTKLIELGREGKLNKLVNGESAPLTLVEEDPTDEVQ